MNKLKYYLQRWMAGRYGVDSLGKFCLAASVLLILLSGVLVRIPALAGLVNTAGIVLLFYAYFRMFSRNIPGRYNENRWFQKKTGLISRAAGDRTHRYYICASCGQTIRVPRGKGRIQITCPRCRHSFIKRT